MKKKDLRLEDTYVETKNVGNKTFSNVKAHQVIAVNHSSKRRVMVHMDRRYWLTPHGFSSVPESIAMELYDEEEITILSMQEAQKWIKMARDTAIEANKDILEYNKKATTHNKKHKGLNSDSPMIWPIKKWRHVEGNSPYQHFVNRKMKKARKKRK